MGSQHTLAQKSLVRQNHLKETGWCQDCGQADGVKTSERGAGAPKAPGSAWDHGMRSAKPRPAPRQAVGAHAFSVLDCSRHTSIHPPGSVPGSRSPLLIIPWLFHLVHRGLRTHHAHTPLLGLAAGTPLLLPISSKGNPGSAALQCDSHEWVPPVGSSISGAFRTDQSSSVLSLTLLPIL